MKGPTTLVVVLAAFVGAACASAALTNPAPAAAASSGAAAPALTNRFDLQDGDRVVLLGDSLIELEQQLGYLETRLTLQYPSRSIRFRNLGWGTNALAGASGLSAEAATPGLDRLKDLVAPFKPTVAIVACGTDLSGGWETNLAGITTTCTRLMDGVAAASGTNPVRFLLLGPLPAGTLASWASAAAGTGPAATGVTARANAVLQDLAARRQAGFVALSELLEQLPRFVRADRLTNRVVQDNRLTAYGWRLLTDLMPWRLGWEANIWRVGITRDGKFREGGWGLQPADLVRGTNLIRFTGLLEQLPSPLVLESNRPLPGLANPGTIQFAGLPAGVWTLRVDGQPVKTLLEVFWNRGALIDAGPDFEQAEQLRQTIVRKNELFRQRLQAATPDLAVRLDEQIAAQEKEIARLRQPLPRLYELRPGGPAASTNAPATR